MSERRIRRKPVETISGDGIILRPVAVADSEIMFNLVKDWPDYLRFFWGPFEPGCKTLNDWQRRNATKHPGLKSFVILNDETLVGQIEAGNLGDGKWIIGFWIGTQYTGRGYAKKAVTALTDHIFKAFGAQTIDANVDRENLTAKAVAIDTGFRLSGSHPDIPNHLVFALNRPEK